MPTFEYKEIADFAANDLWGYAGANVLNNGTRYIAEDVLGNPAANSNNVTFAAPVIIENDLLGARAIFLMAGTMINFVATDGAVPIEGLNSPSAPDSARLHNRRVGRAGSVIGMSTFVNITAFVSNVSFKVNVLNGGATLITGATISVTGTGLKSDYASYARGATTFGATAQLGSYIDITSAGNASGFIQTMIYVQFDT